MRGSELESKVIGIILPRQSGLANTRNMIVADTSDPDSIRRNGEGVSVASRVFPPFNPRVFGAHQFTASLFRRSVLFSEGAVGMAVGDAKPQDDLHVRVAPFCSLPLQNTHTPHRPSVKVDRNDRNHAVLVDISVRSRDAGNS